MAKEYIKNQDGTETEIGSTKTAYIPDIYSLDEVRVGTWIDGKPIYKKTIAPLTLGGGPNEYTINHNISNFKQLINLEGVVHNTIEQSFWTVPS
jgi:hypothetical protein